MKHSSTPPIDQKPRPKKATETRVHIDAIALDPANACRHSERNLKVIQTSIEELGLGRSVLLDADGIVRAGNGTITAARAAGTTKVRIIETDGTEIIAVKRTDLTGARAVAMGLTDNRASDLHEYSEAALRSAVESIGELELDLDALALTDEDIDAMCDLGEVEEPAPEIVEDVVPEPPSEPITKPCDLWFLGEHRLLCGDSTKAADVKRLMDGAKAALCVTSPPYASQRKYDEASEFKPIAPNEYGDWWKSVQHNAALHLASDGSLCLNIKEHSEDGFRDIYVHRLVLSHVLDWGWRLVDEFCWERHGIPGDPLRMGRLKNQWEPVFWFARQKPKFMPQNVAYESDTAIIDDAYRPGISTTQGAGKDQSLGGKQRLGRGRAYPGNRLPIGASQALGHPAAYPVSLPAFFIKLLTDPSNVVFDPFSGSGSTLIAAEQLGRTCYGMEISPAYCDVIVARWEKLTGNKAVRATK